MSGVQARVELTAQEAGQVMTGSARWQRGWVGCEGTEEGEGEVGSTSAEAGRERME